MGDALNPEMMTAFLEEVESIQKEAGLLGSAGKAIARFGKGQAKGVLEAGKRVLNPVKGMKAGWKDLTPAAKYQGMARGKLRAARTALKPSQRHLADQSRSLKSALTRPGDTGRTRAVAEELSRRGWTGKSRVGKYLPVGGKGLTVGLSGLAVPDMVSAAKKDPTATGQGGAAELGLGEAAGLGGMVLGSGLGMAPAMGLWYGANRLGSGAGRIMDRLRGGANMDTAVNAPSPEEAQAQLQQMPSMSPDQQQATLSKLKRYYG